MKQRVFVPFLAALAACAIALAPSSASAQQPDLTDRDRDIQDAYEVMSGVTMGLLSVTAIGGMVQLYNLPTALGDGACSRGEAFLGDYACERHASLIHGGLGILSVASYTATAALAFAAPPLLIAAGLLEVRRWPRATTSTTARAAAAASHPSPSIR